MAHLLDDGLSQLAVYLGRTLDTQEKASAGLHLQHAANMAHAYTRGKGFNPYNPNIIADALLAVIVGKAVRTMHNPTDLGSWASAGVSQRPGRTSWTLAELQVLDRFKRSAGSIPASTASDG